MQVHDEPQSVQPVDEEEFRALLVSRRSLERIVPRRRREPGHAFGLRDRRTGTVYVRSPGADSERTVARVPAPFGRG
jgi:hypothetical protein